MGVTEKLYGATRTGQLRPTGVGERRLTVVCMESNTITNT